MDLGFVAVALESPIRVAADGADAFFAAFSPDADAFGDRIVVFDVERGQFGDARSGAVEEFQNGGVAGGHPGGSLFVRLDFERHFKEVLDLFQRKDDGEFFLLFGKLDVEQGVQFQALAVSEEFVEAAQGREVEADGGAGNFLLHELEEVISEEISIALEPVIEAR